jgi:hypothetical protein
VDATPKGIARHSAAVSHTTRRLDRARRLQRFCSCSHGALLPCSPACFSPKARLDRARRLQRFSSCSHGVLSPCSPRVFRSKHASTERGDYSASLPVITALCRRVPCVFFAQSTPRQSEAATALSSCSHGALSPRSESESSTEEPVSRDPLFREWREFPRKPIRVL